MFYYLFYNSSLLDNKKDIPFSNNETYIKVLMYGTIAYIFSSPKLGMASLMMLFAIGLLILMKVDTDLK